MSRYISVDFILNECDEFSLEGENLKNISGNSAPTIDIVRCGECKFWAGHSIGNLDDWEECRWREDEATDANDFCSYGEVRDE